MDKLQIFKLDVTFYLVDPIKCLVGRLHFVHLLNCVL